MSVVLLPDAEALVTSFLRADDDMYDLVGARVYTAVPEKAGFPLLRVRRVAGAPVLNRPLHLDAPVLQLDGYADTKKEARKLIETARAVLAARLPGTHDEGVVSGVLFGSMSWLPDEDFKPPKPRYVADVTVFAHP